jgi:hypothetical protein
LGKLARRKLAILEQGSHQLQPPWICEQTKGGHEPFEIAAFQIVGPAWLRKSTYGDAPRRLWEHLFVTAQGPRPDAVPVRDRA